MKWAGWMLEEEQDRAHPHVAVSPRRSYASCPMLVRGSRRYLRDLSTRQLGVQQLRETQGSLDDVAMGEMEADVSSTGAQGCPAAWQKVGPRALQLLCSTPSTCSAPMPALGPSRGLQEAGRLDLLMHMPCSLSLRSGGAGKMLQALAAHDAGERQPWEEGSPWRMGPQE